MVRSEQGSTGDTQDPSNIPVLAKCTSILTQLCLHPSA